MPRGLIDPALLTDIADAIRAKTGSNGTYTPAQMATAIANITTGDEIDHEDLPSYVKDEALSVAERVNAKLAADSIVFMVGSDSHQSTTAHVADGNLHGGMAMKALAYMLPLDFAVYLGDYTAGSATTTIAEGLQHIADINEDIDEAFRGLPQFRTVGNHDPLGYSYNQNGEALTQAELYALIGTYNAAAGDTMGSITAGYCYRDFASKRVRVICLNTADTEISSQGSAEAMSNAQKTWFASTMASTPQGYGLLIFSHHPLDWGGVCAASNLVYDYVNGNSYNANYVIAFHGHTHCYKVDYLYHIVNNVGTPYTVKRIAVPNMCFVRNNEYGNNGAPEYYGIEFGETTTYNKTADSGEDTAFCVMVINPSEEKVYAIHYGAGYDREVYFGSVPVAVEGISLNASSGTLYIGDTLQLVATITPSDASNKTVLWSTSNSAIATVSATGLVTAVAAGSVTITATTQDGGFTATYTATVKAQPVGNLINDIGYDDGYRLSMDTGELKTKLGGVVIEYIDLRSFMQVDGTVTIRVRGGDFEQRSNPYNDNGFVIYNSNRGKYYSTYLTPGSEAVHGFTYTTSFSNGDLTFVISGLTAPNTSYHRYVRLAGLGSGANLDLRINEDFD